MKIGKQKPFNYYDDDLEPIKQKNQMMRLTNV